MKPITTNTFLKFSFVNDPRLAPNGKTLAYSVRTVDSQNNRYKNDLYLCREGKCRQLTAGGDVLNYCWEDDRHILFSAFRDQERKRKETGEIFTVFYRICIDGGEAVKAFELPLDKAVLTSAGNGLYLVLCRHRNPPPSSFSGGNVTVLTEVPYWGEFGEKFTSGVRKRLYLYNAETKELSPVTRPWFETIKFHCADGKVAVIGVEYDCKATKRYGVYLFDITSGEWKEIIPQEKMFATGAYVFGDQLLITGNLCDWHGYEREYNNFYVLTPGTGEMKEICRYEHNIGVINGTTDAKMGSGQTVKRAGDRLYFTSTREDSIYLYSIGLQGDLRAECCKTGMIASFDIQVGRVVLAAMYGNNLNELYENDVQITDHNGELIRELMVSSPDYEEVKTSDGFTVHGWVMKPVDFDPNRKYPAILHIHGGPSAVFSNIFHCEHQLWANNGYFVFFCNPRGSDGRGMGFRNITLHHGDWDYDSLTNKQEGEYYGKNSKRIRPGGA